MNAATEVDTAVDPAVTAVASSSTPPTNAELEDTVKRITSHKGVEGVIVMDRRGAVLKSTLSDDQTRAHAGVLADLTARAAQIAQLLNPEDELTYLRMYSKQREVMISPDKDYLLVVMQNSSPSGS
mmetsp:Transcript_34817/g.83263  ORF Transcript_34817/g.83263 Transcript_34817/m.83263 type:complete len:126 (-) Transcript_34817:53-430(-)